MTISRKRKNSGKAASAVMGYAARGRQHVGDLGRAVRQDEEAEAHLGEAIAEHNRKVAEESRRAAFRRAREIAQANLREMTPEEDAEITAAAEADPDNPPLTDEFFAKAKPGRPPLLRPKQPVSLRLDADVVGALRASGEGWQTRANGMLREALKLDAK